MDWGLFLSIDYKKRSGLTSVIGPVFAFRNIQAIIANSAKQQDSYELEAIQYILSK